jgi:hypothetical protein
MSTELHSFGWETSTLAARHRSVYPADEGHLRDGMIFEEFGHFYSRDSAFLGAQLDSTLCGLISSGSNSMPYTSPNTKLSDEAYLMRFRV